MSSVGAILGTAAVTVGRGAAAAVGDGLSFASQLLRAVGGESPAAAPGSPATEDILTRRIDELRDRIRRCLATAGIDLSQPVELTSDGLGGIAASLLHPQHAAIEDALSHDVLLARDFSQLDADYGAADRKGAVLTI